MDLVYLMILFKTQIMEKITSSLSEIHRTLTSINAYLAAFALDVENKKKKADKKKKDMKEKKRNILYTKKTNGKIVVNEEFAKSLTLEEKNFYESMANDFPQICQLQEPLTYQQYIVLVQRYPRREVILNMGLLENYSMKSKYVSVYRALLNWLQKNDTR